MNGALWSLTKAQQASPDHAGIAVLRVAVLTQLKEFEKTDEAITEVYEKHGERASVLTVHGDWYMAQSRTAEAVLVYREAYSTSPNVKTMKTLFRTLTVNKEIPAAIELMEQWLTENEKDVGARHLYAQMLVREKDWKQARVVYESLQADGIEDIVMLNNLAVVYQNLNDERALLIAQAAYDKAPESAIVIDTYGWILTENGKTEEGLALLREAYARASTTPSIRYHMGLALSRMGRTTEAREEVEAALTSDIEFPSKEAAKALLTEIKLTN